MDVEREHGWMPGTFDTLDRDHRAHLLAHWRIRNAAPEGRAPEPEPEDPPRRKGGRR